MSKKWYRNRKDVEGCFVNVKLENGTVISGRLDKNGNIPAPTSDDCGYITVLCWVNAVWEKDTGIEDVRLVWDNRNWLEIPVEESHEGDLLEINGNLHRIIDVHRVDKGEIDYWIATDDVDLDDLGKYTKTSVFEGHDIVTRALRNKNRIPDEPGVYKSQNGDLYIKPGTKNGKWYFVPAGVADKVAVVPEYSVTKGFPLMNVSRSIPTDMSRRVKSNE